MLQTLSRNGLRAARYVGEFTWANRPTSAPVGSVALLTAVGSVASAYFLWDGANWLPDCGVLLIKQGAGALASPIGTIAGNGATPAFMAVPGEIILPAGLMIAGRSQLWVKYLVRKRGTGGTWDLSARLGSNSGQSASNNTVMTNTGLTNANNQDYRQFAEAWPVSSTSYVIPNAIGFQGQGTGAIAERTTNFDLAGDNYVTFSVQNANAADNFDLLAYSVHLSVK